MSYYTLRIEFIIQLFREHKLDLLTENRAKIKELIKGYKIFDKEPSYDPQLPLTIETFIL